MSINTKELRARIYKEFNSQAAFSRALGWDCNKINRILKGNIKPDIDECAEITQLLALSEKEYFQIFLPGLSPNSDKKAKAS